MKLTLPFLLITTLIFITSCSDNDDEVKVPDPDPVIELTDQVEEYQKDLLDEGLILAVVNGSDTSFLMNKEGHRVHTWVFSDKLGNDLELLPNGNLLGIFKPDDPQINFGGYGGILKIIRPNNSVQWELNFSNEQRIAHHDVEMLPNGNVLFLVWNKVAADVAQQGGANVTYDLYPEKLIEVNPQNNQIVWEWDSWDHIIQDFDENLPNYGVVNQNPQLIDINYNLKENGDIMHANGIDYDENKDVIYVSVNGYSEVWVIDHSTTTEEAAGHTGGNLGKGGDLLYRFGNPTAYKNTKGERLFYNNHFPNLLEGGEPGDGNILIFMNGNNVSQSTIYELDLPETFNLTPETNNEPAVVWSFTDTELFSGRISGAVRLSNGNTLICEGDFGYWEVTQNGQLAWKFNGFGQRYWRGYGYSLNSEALSNLGISL